MARLFRQMKVPVVDLNDLYENLGGTMAPSPFMKPHGAAKMCHAGTRIFSKL